MGLAGAILYMVAAPLLSGAATFLGRAGNARLIGAEPPPWKEAVSATVEPFVEMSQSPLPDERPMAGFVTAYGVGAALTGGLFWYGSSLVSVALLWFAAALAVPAGRWITAPHGAEEPTGRAILWAAAYFFQMLLLAVGLFLVTTFGAGAGSFMAADLLALGGAPIYFLPGCFFGLAALLALYPRASRAAGSLEADATGRHLALLELGRRYESVMLYSLIFGLHFGGTLLTAFLGLLVCLGVAVLSKLLATARWRWHERPDVEAAVFVLALLAPLINLVVLLGS